MRRPGLRLLLAVAGIALFVVYAGAAYGGYLLLRYLWATRPSPGVLVAELVLVTLVVGYLSYRVGTVRLLTGVGAISIPRERAPALYARFDRLVDRMDAGRPDLRVGSLPGPNALSIGGRRSGVVVFDATLLRRLSVDEAEAILAHEMAHLETHDAFFQTLAYTALQTVVGIVLFVLLPVTLLATGLARAIALIRGRPTAWTENPIGQLRVVVSRAVMVGFAALTIAVRAYARRREFAADRRSAEVTGDPEALVSALRTIDRLTTGPQGLLGHLTTGGRRENGRSRLFATHPDTDERIDRLHEIAAAQDADRWTRIQVT